MNHRIRLTREDGWQVIRVPRELELPGDEVMVHKDQGRLVVEASSQAKTSGLLAWLATLEPLGLEDHAPEMDDSDLLPLDEIDL